MLDILVEHDDQPHRVAFAMLQVAGRTAILIEYVEAWNERLQLGVVLLAVTIHISRVVEGRSDLAAAGMRQDLVVFVQHGRGIAVEQYSTLMQQDASIAQLLD